MKKHLYDFDFDLEAFLDSIDLTLNYDDYDFSFDDIELDFNIEQWANDEKLFFTSVETCWKYSIYHIEARANQEKFPTIKKNNGQI